MPLDCIDRRMLAILQREGRISNAALAERLHLSPSPCLRRLRASSSDGVIVGYRAVLDRDQARAGADRLRRAEGRRHSEADRVGDHRRASPAPEVLSAHIVSGSADLLLEIVVADLAAYERLMFGTLLILPHVIDARSDFALRAAKTDGSLPL